MHVYTRSHPLLCAALCGAAGCWCVPCLPVLALQMFVGVAISDPEVASFLTSSTKDVNTVLFWNSDPSLMQQSRVDGFAPQTAGPFAQLLAQHVGFSREAKASRVLKTLDSLWSRHTSGECLQRLPLHNGRLHDPDSDMLVTVLFYRKH